MLNNLAAIPTDPLLALIDQFRKDERAEKIDLGVGVYRDEQGNTPVMRAVKMAEQVLLDQQDSKRYIGMIGDVMFVEKMRDLTFGDAVSDTGRIAGIQTPGGTGALRLAAELVKRSNPQARIWLGTPSWVNHAPVLEAAELEIEHYNYFDPVGQCVDFEATHRALSSAKSGDVILLQACCHNPTGCDFSEDQWREIAKLCSDNGLIPFIDCAYQGLGLGLEKDRAGIEIVCAAVPEALVTVSCSKNFGLYRERTGALFVLSETPGAAKASMSHLFAIARPNYSMPPDHGAAVVRTILSDADISSVWRDELTHMRGRITAIRAALVESWGAGNEAAAFFTRQLGMFSLLPLTSEQIAQFRDDHAIYMAGSGRINLAGLLESDVERFVSVLKTQMGFATA